MRSKAYCLFVLLTLVVFNLAKDDFCEQADVTKLDCADKALNADDVKWDFITAFNNRKHIPTQNKKFVEVDFNRALFLENTITPVTPVTVAFVAVNPANCKNFMRRSWDTAKQWDDANAQISKEKFVNNRIKPGTTDFFEFTVNAQKTFVVAVFDPECRLRTEISGLDKLTAKHIFTRNVKSETWPEQFWKWEVTENNVPTDKVKELGNYIVGRHHGDDGNVHPDIKERNMIYPFGNRNDSGKRKECFHLCKEGYLFEFKIAAGLAFANTFKVNQNCQWMTIFLNNNVANKMAPAEISFRHGFVALPKEVKAFPMDFETSDATGQHEVSVLYYLESKTVDGQNKNLGNLIIANSHGQAVRSDFVLASTSTIYFEFNDEKCLASPIGQEMVKKSFPVSTPPKEVMVMKEHDFLNSLNLGFNVIMYDNYRSYSYADTHGTYTPLEKTGDWSYWGKNYAGEMAPEAPPDVDGDDVNVDVGQTNPPPTLSIGYTNGQMEPIPTGPPFTIIENERMEAIENEKKRRAEQLRIIMNNKYYFYWAIPAGFGAGSIAAVLICNIIMFVMRRSVCTFWYKAMYKRYGSDTTMGAGTTMGKTGGGETIGGGTTAGGTTSGGTTAGGTTAGETVGSTTAA